MLDISSQSSEVEVLPAEQPTGCSFITKEQCLLNFELDFNEKDLLIGWTFKHMAAKETTCLRHLLVLVGTAQDTSVAELIKTYFRCMKLGSFLKVVNCHKGTVSKWIERSMCETPPNFQCLINRRDMHNTKEALAYSMKQASRNQQHTEISLIVLPSQQIPQAFLQECIELIHKYEYTGHMTVFLPEALRMTTPVIQEAQPFSPIVEFYDSLLLLNNHYMRNLFYDLVKLRARSVEITLKSLNADISVTKHTNSLWQMGQEHNTLVRTLSSLNSYTEYIEKLALMNFGVSHVDFYVQFKTVLLDGETLLMESNFSIRLNTQKSVMSRPPTTKTGNRVRQTCAGTYHGIEKNINLHTEQITIRPSLE